MVMAGVGWKKRKEGSPGRIRVDDDTSLPGILPKSLGKAFPSPPARLLTSFTAQIKNKPTHECAYIHTRAHAHAHEKRRGPSQPW